MNRTACGSLLVALACHLRRAGPALVGAVVCAGIAAPVAAAHHGDTGEYDITQPLFVRGEVLEAQFGYPHATLRVRVARGEDVPDELGRYEPLAELDRAPALEDLRAPGPGELEVLLPPTITADSADPDSGRPDVGETLEGIFLRRCAQGGEYDGEIRSVALSLGANGVSMRPGSSDPTGYHEGCEEETSAGDEERAAAPSNPAAADDGGGTSPLIYAAVTALGLGVLAVLVAAVAGRRGR